MTQTNGPITLGAVSSNYVGKYGTPAKCDGGVLVWDLVGYTLQTNAGPAISDVVVQEDADQSWDALTTQRMCGAYLPPDVSFVQQSGDIYEYSSSSLGKVDEQIKNGYCQIYIVE